jgi:Fe-S cluster assembly protein SufD
MTTATALSGVERYRAEFDALAPWFPHAPDSLIALRREAIERFVEIGFPTRKMEEWRSTNLAPIAETDFRLSPKDDHVSPADLERYRYRDCAELVLVNGRFVPELSRLEGLPEGVTVGGLAETMAHPPQWIEERLGSLVSFAEHPFVALNTAFFEDGVAIHVPRGTVVERPINLILVGRPEEQPIAFFPRLLVVAEEASQVRLVEQYVSVGDGPYLTCPVTEVVVEPSAVVDHYKLQRESTDAMHMATLQIRQDRASNFSSHSISWGGGLVRNDVNSVLAGEGCEGTLNGLYLAEGTQHVDNHMRVEHAAPHCDSHELYKGILEGRSRAVFNGRIYVHPGAQKTDAKQTNRNLLLSPDALCYSNPQLEIFADDVRCTHGSTVGQLDELAVFYLRSRGIGEEAAQSLLTYAFAADIVERIRMPEVRRDLEEFLFRRLPRGEVVRQAV